MSDSEGEWLSAQNPPIDTRNPCTSIAMGKTSVRLTIEYYGSEVVRKSQLGCNDSDSDGPWLSAAVGPSQAVTTRTETTPLKGYDKEFKVPAI